MLTTNMFIKQTFYASFKHLLMRMFSVKLMSLFLKYKHFIMEFRKYFIDSLVINIRLEILEGRRKQLGKCLRVHTLDTFLGKQIT